MLESQMDTETLIKALNSATNKLPEIAQKNDSITFRLSFLGYDRNNRAGVAAREKTLRAWQQIRPYWSEAAARHLTMPVIAEPVKILIERLAMEDLCLKLI